MRRIWLRDVSLRVILSRVNAEVDCSQRCCVLRFSIAIRSNTMHLAHAHGQPDPKGRLGDSSGMLDFLWLELTNRCNLQCVHCYTESNPHSGDRDLLKKEDYETLMMEARALGCRKVQFIGGEPQLNADFDALLIKAKTLGFEFIEVFSNLIRLGDKTVRYAADNGICFATSVYSDNSEEHDAVTKVKSSHVRTIANLKKLIGAGIDTRAAIIVIEQDKASVDRTKSFLRDLGVPHVSHGSLREFGRGGTHPRSERASLGTVRPLLERETVHCAGRRGLPMRNGA